LKYEVGKRGQDRVHTSSTVAVVGLGKIGLPLAVQYAQKGQRVIGCDVDPRVVEMINAGISHIQEEPEMASMVTRLVNEGFLSATAEISEGVGAAETVIVIVPVIIDAHSQVDFKGIDAATEAIGAGLQPGTLVIYETTLPVGTTSRRLRRRLEMASGLRAGQDFYLAYSPERVSSGSIFSDLRAYPKVVGGIDEASTEAGVAFYRSVLDAEITRMASSDEAEFVKLIETTYRDVNIALANEFAHFADTHGLDVMAAIAAANSQPYSHIHAPGVGVGGHCIPVYPYFLLAGAATDEQHPLVSNQRSLTLPRVARQINDAMAGYAVRRLEQVIGPLADQAVLILGVAYRGNVREIAFTSAQQLRDELAARGAKVYADDPLFSAGELQEWGYTPLPPRMKGEIRALLLQANHRVYQQLDFSDFPHCQVVLDGRRALNRAQIEAAGMHYIAIGDGVGMPSNLPGAELAPIGLIPWNGGQR
jgi:nucleotide sugar dehydrogenase